MLDGWASIDTKRKKELDDIGQNRKDTRSAHTFAGLTSSELPKLKEVIEGGGHIQFKEGNKKSRVLG